MMTPTEPDDDESGINYSMNNDDIKPQDEYSNNSTSVEESVVASPSIESFSTFPDQDEDTSVADGRDLQVKVDSPQKHVETLETYITFRIITKSTRPEYDETEYTVRRRYNDFIWLRQKLVECYPTHIIPPMPGKHSLLGQLDRYSKEFIIARMKLLHIFLNRIVNHPILSCDQNLHLFLTAKSTDFTAHRKNRNSVGKVTNSINNLTVSTTLKQRHTEFELVKDYCEALGEKLTTIDKISRRIQKERQDCLIELNQLHPVFSLWANSEPELAEILKAIAKALESNATAHQKLIEFDTNEEREYNTYVEAVKDALNRRDAMQVEYEVTSDELTKRRNEKEKIEGSQASDGTNRWDNSFWKTESNGAKLDRLSQTVIPRISRIVEILQDRLQCANENLRSDLERWNKEKRVDLKKILIAMADQQIAHYQQCTNAWEEALTTVKSTNKSTANSST